MLLRSPWLVLLLLVTACASVDKRSVDEQLASQLVFTVPIGTSAHMPGLSTSARASFTGRSSDEINLIEVVLKQHQLRKISQWSIRSLGVEAVLAEPRKDKASVDSLIKQLEQDRRIESVQPVHTFKLLTYNDPYFELQNAVQGDDIEQIHRLATGKDVVVGIVDTGVDRRHPELAGRIVYTRNHVAHDPYRFDTDEHGTAVAGVIASSANNDLGIVGVAPDARMMVFKACWEAQTGNRQAQCDSASLARALEDVLARQPDILNLSLAGPSDPLLERLLRAASNAGIVLIAAQEDASAVTFPASMPEVIAVGRPLDGARQTVSPGILAPGTDVLTTTPGATYAFRSGSSMATAYVSGVTALLKERNPGLDGSDVRAHLQETAQEGTGAVPVVDVCAAVRQQQETCHRDSVAVNP